MNCANEDGANRKQDRDMAINGINKCILGCFVSHPLGTHLILHSLLMVWRQGTELPFHTLLCTVALAPPFGPSVSWCAQEQQPVMMHKGAGDPQVSPYVGQECTLGPKIPAGFTVRYIFSVLLLPFYSYYFAMASCNSSCFLPLCPLKRKEINFVVWK